MARQIEFGSGLWVFGQFMDRYVGGAAYGPPVGTLEAIKRAGQVGDVVALDFMYPWGEQNLSVADVKAALEDNGLRTLAISPGIFGGEYQQGSFTHPDAKMRQKAIDLCKYSMDAARELGASYLKLWPGQDGYDYPFQANYAQIWDYSVSGVREVAEFAPDMQIAIEYKFKEPRVHMSFSTAARTLIGIQEMGVDNVGIVMDLGHSLFAKETPADALQLVHKHGKLTSVELNDNWREWDDDLTVGSVHLVETIEFIHVLRNLDFDGPWLLDQFPFREDPVAAARASINAIKAINNMLDDLDEDTLKAAQDRQDALAAQQIIQKLLFGRYM